MHYGAQGLVCRCLYQYLRPTSKATVVSELKWYLQVYYNQTLEQICVYRDSGPYLLPGKGIAIYSRCFLMRPYAVS